MPFPHPRLLQHPQALDQQRTGNLGQAILQLVKPAAAQQQLAQDEGIPPLGENLCCFGYRAKLSVSSHNGSLPHTWEWQSPFFGLGVKFCLSSSQQVPAPLLVPQLPKKPTMPLA